jgi:AraC family transcriptional regulator
MDTRRTHQIKINRALQYIERNIDKPLSLQDVAQMACLSPYHFHRLFRSIVGEPLYDYIKRIRLESAALQLRYTGDTVDKVSEQTGYARSTSFSKAFRKQFGRSPRGYRGEHTGKHSGPARHLIGISRVDLEPIRLVYLRKVGDYKSAAAKAWQELLPMAYQQGLINHQTRAIGVTYDSPDITESFRIRYDACVTVSDTQEVADTLNTQTLAGGHYVRFRHAGPYENMEETYQYIYGQWLADNDAELRNVPVFCRYHQLDPSHVDPKELLSDIFIPLR